jgi:hypothetical protein
MTQSVSYNRNFKHIANTKPSSCKSIVEWWETATKQVFKEQHQDFNGVSMYKDKQYPGLQEMREIRATPLD